MQSRIFSRPVAGAIGFVVSRPVAFWINAALVSTWLYLLWPLFSPVYLNPIYVAYLMILTIPVLGYASLALIGSRRTNIGLLMGCVFGFAFGEIYLRLWIPEPEQRFSAPIVMNGQRPYYMFTGVPNSSGRMIPQQGGNDSENDYRINSLGFRIERPLVKSKLEGELRIVVIGGSTVFNGAPLEKTIPGQIESELRNRGFSGAKVYNFGIVAAVSGQELALLTHLL
ncbi:MAG: hypothetical protein WB691_04175, partial [Pseudolabrys sp.]